MLLLFNPFFLAFSRFGDGNASEVATAPSAWPSMTYTSLLTFLFLERRALRLSQLPHFSTSSVIAPNTDCRAI